MPFNLGFTEMLVIFIVALLVVGPRKLPDLGKSLGKGLREFRKATEDLKSNWEEQIRETETSVSEVKETLNEVKTDIESSVTLEDTTSPDTITPDTTSPETTSPEAPETPAEPQPESQEAKPDAHKN